MEMKKKRQVYKSYSKLKKKYKHFIVLKLQIQNITNIKKVIIELKISLYIASVKTVQGKQLV